MAKEYKSLDEYYEILKAIDTDWKRSIFYPPLTDEQINKFELEKNIFVPESYKEWLRISNGSWLFGSSGQLYGINNLPKIASIKYGSLLSHIPHEYLVLGYFHTPHICYSQENGTFFFYEYEDPTTVFEECEQFDSFAGILDYILDICTN